MLDRKLRHVEKGIKLRVEDEEGTVVVVGRRIVKTKHAASIKDHGHSDDLKKRTILVFQNSEYKQSDKTMNKGKNSP